MRNLSRHLGLVVAAMTALAGLTPSASAGVSAHPDRSAPPSARSTVSAAATPPSTAGTFRPVTPIRLLDTRSGFGAAAHPVAPFTSLVLQVAGRGGVPASNVGAVVLTVVIAQPTADGHLSVYADGLSRPATSNLNFGRGQTAANTVVVSVGTNGRVRIFNGSPGTVRMLADVTGYYLGGTPSVAGSFRRLAPVRLLDTRVGVGAAARSVGANGTVDLQITGRGGVPVGNVAAVILNVTVTAPVRGGFLTVYANGQGRPAASDLNFAPHQSVANAVQVAVGTGGRVRLFNGSAGAAEFIADVSGYYLAGTPAVAGSFQAVAPTRLLDTRSGLGAAARRVAGNSSIALQVTGATSGGVLRRGISAVVFNVTVTAPSHGGYLTLFPDGRPRPETPSLNFSPRQDAGNMVVVPVGVDGRVVFANRSVGSVEMVADVMGVFFDGSPRPRSCDTVADDPNGTAITRWNPITLCVLTLLGQSAGNLSDVNTMIRYESSGDPDAINLTDINAQRGHPSEGLIQVIRPTFDQWRSTLLVNDLFDPAANLYAGLNYAIHTYGSIHDVPGLVALRHGKPYTGYFVHRG